MDAVRWAAFGLGAVGGGLAAWATFALFQRQLDASFAAGQADLQAQLQAGSSTLTRQFTAAESEAARTVLTLVNATVPAAVDGAIVTTLNTYGLTPTVLRKVTAILNALPG